MKFTHSFLYIIQYAVLHFPMWCICFVFFLHVIFLHTGDFHMWAFHMIQSLLWDSQKMALRNNSRNSECVNSKETIYVSSLFVFHVDKALFILFKLSTFLTHQTSYKISVMFTWNDEKPQYKCTKVAQWSMTIANSLWALQAQIFCIKSYFFLFLYESLYFYIE